MNRWALEIPGYLCFMAQEIKPLKRSPQLTPLSHDHYDGLLFASRIRQGIKKGADHGVIARYVLWFWENHLREHFREEEEILAPHLPAGNEGWRRMVDEHQEIESMIHITENIPDEHLFQKLADAITDHIRFEEREFFPYAEKMIPATELDSIYEAIVKNDRSCPKWDNPFWERKKD